MSKRKDKIKYVERNSTVGKTNNKQTNPRSPSNQLTKYYQYYWNTSNHMISKNGNSRVGGPLKAKIYFPFLIPSSTPQTDKSLERQLKFFLKFLLSPDLWEKKEQLKETSLESNLWKKNQQIVTLYQLVPQGNNYRKNRQKYSEFVKSSWSTTKKWLLSQTCQIKNFKIWLILKEREIISQCLYEFFFFFFLL